MVVTREMQLAVEMRALSGDGRIDGVREFSLICFNCEEIQYNTFPHDQLV